MKLILLSGGSGKRLWPLSNDARSKQFLRVLPGKDGEKESMVQRVWRQIKEVGLGEDAFIVTGKSQSEIIHNQIGEHVPIIIEPERRDTFAAIMLAAAHIYSNSNATLDETVIVMPVDPYVELNFFHTLKELERHMETAKSDLSLIGVKPTYPSEKYGYILPESKDPQGVQRVKSFIEKPKVPVAESLIEQGALWNCGIFAAKLEFFTDIIQKRNLPLNADDFVRQYKGIVKNSFDYEVVEHTESISVSAYDGDWKDLGTWNTLTEEMSESISGKGKRSHDSLNTHIVNELDIPIAVLGVSNVVVAASPDGILIADKEQSPRIKELLSDDDSRPMFVERNWGWYSILECSQNKEGQEVTVRKVCVFANKHVVYRQHQEQETMWCVISGQGLLTLNGTQRLLKAGTIVQIPKGQNPILEADSEMEIIETQLGLNLISEPIHEFELIEENV
ncbi:mannose-1-phosphate guanylyltransferase [Saccharibacillus sp. O16]|nr:mannose-1-phosphate guanylyltransferase [Saccharibacillus sp. O16]